MTTTTLNGKDLIQGKEYLVEYRGKTVKAIYGTKGGNEVTGYDSHIFKLKRKQKFTHDGETRTLTYAFVNDSEVPDKVKEI
ncbi:hypothetical protein M3_0089 [Lysinibacillus phage vB_LfM_LysYB1]|nr:hypothetical protein M3_0089 [Lysinibacillus phage vB_LfM_LysYB1]WAB25402.1 hypothetical protein M5_0224 [Lysinibacillus phage vB_LfM_LysYB2]